MLARSHHLQIGNECQEVNGAAGGHGARSVRDHRVRSSLVAFGNRLVRLDTDPAELRRTCLRILSQRVLNVHAA